MEEPFVYLNGAMTPLSEAKISVFDCDFIFGDGIYEVITVYGRKPFRPVQYLARFFRSIEAVNIRNQHSQAEWLALINKVVQAAPTEDQLTYLQITRGPAPRTHAFPTHKPPPSVFLMANPLVPPTPAMLENSVAYVTMTDKRWLRCEIKSISLLGNVLAAQNTAAQQATQRSSSATAA